MCTSAGRPGVSTRQNIWMRAKPDGFEFTFTEPIDAKTANLPPHGFDLARPAATFPRDIFYGSSNNRFVDRSVRQFNCGWELPQRWTGKHPCGGGAEPASCSRNLARALIPC